MADGAFNFETCLLKHHVRKNYWLPFCKDRLNTIRANDNSHHKRRLRYFTFCAVGAIDVLMLDVAKVIWPSANGRFDTVFFFDKNSEYISETQKRIPGARGFPGDFINIVLLEDPKEDNLLESGTYLDSRVEEEDEFEIRDHQRILQMRSNFIRCFPFDVINLDLEQFLFKPNDPIPGKVISAMRKIFLWQTRPMEATRFHKATTIDGFTLMFTTQIGPKNLNKGYLDMLEKCIDDNIKEDREVLLPMLEKRSNGLTNVHQLREKNFDLFFKLAMPKILAEVLIEQDWYVDPRKGIEIIEFERSTSHGSYKMLHLVMDVKRQNPTKDNRGPRLVAPSDLLNSHNSVIRQLFGNEGEIISEESIDKVDLQKNLDLIISRRKKYMGEDE